MAVFGDADHSSIVIYALEHKVDFRRNACRRTSTWNADSVPLVALVLMLIPSALYGRMAI